METFLKFLCEKIWPLMVDRWGRRSTIFSAASVLFLALLCFLTNGAISTVSLAQLSFIFVAVILLWFVWFITVRVPKCKKGRVGIALAVFAEDDKQYKILKADFIDEFREIIDRSVELRNIFDVVEIPQRHARAIRTSEQANSYRSVARCQLIVYGHTRLRPGKGRDIIKVHLDCLIAHKEVKREVSKIFSRDINAVFPARLDIDAEDECQQFEITAKWLGLAAKCIVGTAAILSDASDLALSIFKSLRQEVRLNASQLPSLRNIKHLVPIRLADIYRSQIHRLITQWEGSRDIKYLSDVRDILKNLDVVAPGDYAGRLWSAYILFVVDHDSVSALREISRCKNQRDATWRYSRAFLLAYDGQLDEAKKEYKKAFDRGCHESLLR